MFQVLKLILTINWLIFQTLQNKDFIGNVDQNWNELSFTDIALTKQGKSAAAIEIFNFQDMFTFTLNTC